MHKFNIFTLDKKSYIKSKIDILSSIAWPGFLLHGDVRNWSALFDKFSDYQLLFYDFSERLLAVGHTVPLSWDGTDSDLPDSIDLTIHRALSLVDTDQKPDALSAVAIMVDPEFRGQGLSSIMVEEMKKLALNYNARWLIAPVRPTLKEKYPQVPFDKYIRWKNDNGEPFDPWIRVHMRLGARIAKVIPKGLTVAGTVDNWRQWTGIEFTKSGNYEVPGALEPVHIDIEKDEGIYHDPNVWMVHEAKS